MGDRRLDYSAGQALVVTVELPAYGRVTKASAAEPYLGLTLEFDTAVLHEIMAQIDTAPKPRGNGRPGLFVEAIGEPLKDCLARLIRLGEMPEAVPVLYPILMREVCFWLLTGTNAAEVAKVALPVSHTRRIADAINLLRENYRQAVRVDDLAAAARMSPSSFHQHFKTLTLMTPLQYQKQLRLLEARRLMVAEAASVTSAALDVGYESPSQFSREYSRMFGRSPKQDTSALKAGGPAI